LISATKRCRQPKKAVAMAHLFDAVRIINAAKDGKETLTRESINYLKETFSIFMNDIFGLRTEVAGTGDKIQQVVEGLMGMILDFRKQARDQKDWSTSDKIRDELARLKIAVKDGKDGASWEINN
jgi:cysteinyl-tRNA synthetase